MTEDPARAEAPMALVRRQLVSGCVWLERDDRQPVDGLTRAVRDGGDHRGDALVLGVVAALVDPDRVVRTRAIDAAQRLAGRIAAGTLARLLRERGSLFRGVPPAARLDQTDLGWGLLRAIAAAARPSDIAALALLRQAVSDPQQGFWVLAGLTMNDPRWVAEHSAVWFAGDPSRLVTALHWLRDPDWRMRVVRDLAAQPAERHAELREAIREVVVDPFERLRLEGALGG
jgi:hypothetical protein